MAKPVIPNYSIDHVRELNPGPQNLVAMRLEEYLATRHFLLTPHRHSFYHIVYFIKGKGDHFIDFVNFPIRNHQVYFMIPGQVHNWKYNGDVKGYVINFTDSFFLTHSTDINFLEQFPFFSGYCEDQVILLKGTVKEEVVSLFEKILDEKCQPDSFASEMIRTLLMQLFITVSRNKPQAIKLPENRQGQKMLRNFKKLVDEQFTLHMLPRDYARQLNVTPNYLNSLTNTQMGKSAGEVIRDRIILEAKRLLVNADLTIAEIASRLYFEDNSYFTKFFKKHVQLTPEQFRIEYQVPASSGSPGP
ncbi:AraC family transcriptional regulator [Chitinophagaceae bacterium LB-8]|uniref:AraC family transcriptional regulator n=1 Tax=Paraflavisolibacter caeni TaxID=2982496 RepID=A0A9X3BFK3_9BACT|nr:helix-turn-helix transcriptional regulator [Paraflavisolibacter caeni]MCU7549069.1 AraC family transcriptional regulator [Paraflavisolibacter caeni]